MTARAAGADPAGVTARAARLEVSPDGVSAGADPAGVTTRAAGADPAGVSLSPGAVAAVSAAADDGGASPPCGAVVLPGSAWLGGDGVDVFSNGADAGSGTSCGGISTVGTIVSGQEWQCVELVDRLYLERGWIRSTWFGNGADLYAKAPLDLAEQRQGSISFLSPGDVVSYQSPGGVEPGHAGIVNTVTPISLGRFEVQLVQQNGFLFTSGILSNGTLTMTTGWVSDYPVIGVIHHPGATAIAAEPPDLLQNSSFENDVTTGWTTLNPAGGTVQELAAKASGLPEGSNLLEISTSRPNGSVYQNVPLNLEPGESYTFSIWARAKGPRQESICAVLWGFGQSTEYGETCVRVGSYWTLVSAPYDVRGDGLTELRAQVYLHTAMLHLDLTGASLVDDSLASASFQNGLTTGWTTLDPAGGLVRARATSANDLPQGRNLLELSTSRPRGSVFQEVAVNLERGQSYTFSIWARANSAKREKICVVLWGIGRSTQNGQTCASVAEAWMPVSAPYDVSASGLTQLRAQVYLLTPGARLDLTGGSLVDDGLANASFEDNQTGGWKFLRPPGGAVQAHAAKASGLPEGGNLLELRTSRPDGSVYQDVPENLEQGQSYTFSIWARANASTTENICVVLWGLGHGSEYGETCVNVGQTWTLVSAPYDVRASGLTALQAQVYLHTTRLPLDLTGASLGRGT